MGDDKKDSINRYKGKFIKKGRLLNILRAQERCKTKKSITANKNTPETETMEVGQKPLDPPSYEFVECGHMSQSEINEEVQFDDSHIDGLENEEADSSDFNRDENISHFGIEEEEPKPHSSNQQMSSIEEIVSGNRIVNLSFLANALECSVCKNLLHLRHIEKETRCGLGSFLYIRCMSCDSITRVNTSEYSENEGSERESFKINSLMALGCIQSNINNQNLNKLLTCLKIAPLPWNTQQYYESQIKLPTEAAGVLSGDEATTEDNVEDTN